MLAGHAAGDGERWLSLLIAFMGFSAAASLGYVFNDLRDVESDKLHPRKKNRPFARGALSAAHGYIIMAALLVVAAVSALLLPVNFGLMLLIYLLLTLSYSSYLKQKMIIDVICLAGLYTLRVVAGGLATDITPSPWLLAFSLFLFLSLAFAKRYAELLRLLDDDSEKAHGRGYSTQDLDLVRIAGMAAGYAAVMVFCLYLNSQPRSDVTDRVLYEQPYFLWLVVPVLLYWVTRLWFLAHRRILDDDPLVFALKDRVSYVCVLLVAGCVVLAAAG
jgi:4-hydroxybenzoate polyprenyltransferase